MLAVRNQLSDDSLLADLLAFLRGSGCIAYDEPERRALEVLRPHSFHEKEDAEIEQLLNRWLAEHPHVRAETRA